MYITASNKKEARKELKKWIEEIERKNSPMKKYTIREFSKTWIQKQVIPNSKTERTPDKYRNKRVLEYRFFVMGKL